MLCRCVLYVVVFDPKGHRQGCSQGLLEGRGPGITREETAGNIRLTSDPGKHRGG
ncbi:hypothetical protein ACRRTK_022400 [Alexandromys fortis]